MSDDERKAKREARRQRHLARLNEWRGNSTTRPERVCLRCTMQQHGRFWAAVKLAKELRRAATPDAELLMCEAIHDVIIPTFEKVMRGFLYGSAAERSMASVYLEKFIRKDDYLSVRRSLNPLQQEFSFGGSK